MTSRATKERTTEKALHLLWRRIPSLGGRLVTLGGEPLRILYPGRPSPQAGPDFRDAVIATKDGRLIKGDVELHVDASGWREHGHHLDPNYNGVVLHVVLRPKKHRTSPLQSRLEVPILALEPAMEPLQEASARLGSPFSYLSSLDEEDLGCLLDRLGDQRFLAKSRGLAIEMENQGPEQALYAGLMECMGYGDNRKPFRELAKRVTIEAIAPLAKEPTKTRLMAIQALLLSVSGLLDGAVSDDRNREMKAILRRIPRIKGMSSKRWRLFRVRPNNHPARRIVGMAYLIDRHITLGLIRGLMGLLRSEGCLGLIRGLAVPPYIGTGRARDMSVNVALPFIHAWAQKARDPLLERLCLDAYARHPKSSDNQITKEVKGLLLLQGHRCRLVSTARRQQGLIHLYKSIGTRFALSKDSDVNLLH